MIMMCHCVLFPIPAEITGMLTTIKPDAVCIAILNSKKQYSYEERVMIIITTLKIARPQITILLIMPIISIIEQK